MPARQTLTDHSGPPGRRNDPGRRDRIIDACLYVIAESGVAGTSHRRVAEEAGVPLGSMTYYFSGMEELLHEAFSRFARATSDKFAQRMSYASGIDAAKRAVADTIIEASLGPPRDLVLTHELYSLAAREPAYREITNDWMARSRHALEQHFDPATSRVMEALIEGLSIHRALDNQTPDDAVVFAALDRLTLVRN